MVSIGFDEIVLSRSSIFTATVAPFSRHSMVPGQTANHYRNFHLLERFRCFHLLQQVKLKSLVVCRIDFRKLRCRLLVFDLRCASRAVPESRLVASARCSFGRWKRGGWCCWWPQHGGNLEQCISLERHVPDSEPALRHGDVGTGRSGYAATRCRSALRHFSPASARFGRE